MIHIIPPSYSNKKKTMPMPRRSFLLFPLLILGLFMMFQPVSPGSAQASAPTPTFLPSPTPARPDAGINAYRLKQWTEADAQSVATIFDQKQAELEEMYRTGLELASDPPYNNLDFHQAAMLLMKETLVHFPDWEERDALSRQLFYRSITYQFGDTSDANELLRVQLEQAINADPQGLAALENWLKANMPDVTIASSQTVPNLFGTGYTGEVIELEYNNFAAFIALQTDSYGKKHIYPIMNRWAYTWYESVQVSTEDLNGNGLPDIAVHHYVDPPGFIHWCQQYLNIYEWDGQQFTEYSKPLGYVYVEDEVGTCEGWEYQPGDQGTKIIVSQQGVGGLGETSGFSTRSTRYAWNGAQFEWAGEEVTPPIHPEDLMTAAQWAYEAGPHNELAFSILKKAVQNWPVALEKVWGPAAQDFLRYKLGLWYAFRGDAGNATTLLTQVRDHPTHSDFSASSRIAAAFLQGYSDRGSFAGCSAVINTLSNEYYSLPQTHGVAPINAQHLTAMWGFYDLGWNFYSHAFWPAKGRGQETPICSLTEAFQSSLTQTPIHTQTELIAWLSRNRVPWNGLHAGELNGDGLTDWLVMVATGEKFRRDLWALIQQPSGILAIQVDLLSAGPNIATSYRSFQPAKEAGVYHAYQAGKQVLIFHLVQTGGQTAIVIDATASQDFPEPYVDVAAQRIDVLGKEPEQQLFIRGADGVNGSISWDTDFHRLKLTHTPLRQAERVSQIEKALLVDQNPAEAQSLILSLMRGGINEEPPDRYSSEKFVPRIRPYLTYLLGLTYELTGEPAKAAQTYYQLWRDHPENPYAIIAREKLERNP